MWGAVLWGFTAWLRNRWVTENPGPLTGHWSRDSDCISQGSLSPVTLFPTWQKLWKWVPPCSHLKTMCKSKLGVCVHARLVIQSCPSLWDLMDWVKPGSPALQVDSLPPEPPGKPTLSAPPSSWGVLVTQGWGGGWSAALCQPLPSIWRSAGSTARQRTLNVSDRWQIHHIDSSS